MLTFGIIECFASQQSVSQSVTCFSPQAKSMNGPQESECNYDVSECRGKRQVVNSLRTNKRTTLRANNRTKRGESPLSRDNNGSNYMSRGNSKLSDANTKHIANTTLDNLDGATSRRRNWSRRTVISKLFTLAYGIPFKVTNKLNCSLITALLAKQDIT